MVVLARVAVPRAEPSRLDAVIAFEPRLGDRLEAGRVLVDDSLVAPSQALAEQLLAPVEGIIAVAQQVGVGTEPREVEITDHEIVGVDYPDVVALACAELQRLGPVGAEVSPGPLVDLAGNARGPHVRFDGGDGAVLRARVDDHPVVDERPDALQRLGDHVLLVAHDHAEADARASGPFHRADLKAVPGLAVEGEGCEHVGRAELRWR